MRSLIAIGMRTRVRAMRWAVLAAGLGGLTLALAGSAPGTAAAPHLTTQLSHHTQRAHRKHRTHRKHRRHRAKSTLTIYSLVHRCEAVTNAGTGQALTPGSGPVRMQAAALATYLLYTADGQFLTDTSADSPTLQPGPSTAAEWLVTGTASRGFTLTNLATHAQTPVEFSSATGCATYPEAQIGATGTSFAGASPEANALGTVEGHAHITAFELFGGDWHCGRPWSPFGVVYALPASCASQEQGTNGTFEQALDFGGSPRPADFHGWPTFVGWPSPTALAEEGDYYTGVERAWQAGLRVFVTDLVDNEELCKLMTTTHLPCNDMNSVHVQSSDLYALQNYIDAQSGGPGKGWFRIVTDPFQARRVINQGKLAVIEGIEVSRIFGCGEMNNVPECGPSQVDAGLKEVHALGVRTFFPVHEFDNAFGGTKMIAGQTGAIVNAGNHQATGSFWTVEPCPADQQDAEQTTVPGADLPASLLNGPVSGLTGGNPLPVYASGPQCNVHGLTGLGGYLVNQMINQHFIIQTDHMSSKTAAAAVAIATARHYSGVVSAHCCSSPQLFGQIYGDGGFVSEPAGPSDAFVNIERTDKAAVRREISLRVRLGLGHERPAEQPGPSSADPVSLPVPVLRRARDLHPRGVGPAHLRSQHRTGWPTTGCTPTGCAASSSPAATRSCTTCSRGLRPTCRCGNAPMASRPRAASPPAPGSARAVSARACTSGRRRPRPCTRPVSRSTRPGRSFRYCVAGSSRPSTSARCSTRAARSS